MLSEDDLIPARDWKVIPMSTQYRLARPDQEDPFPMIKIGKRTYLRKSEVMRWLDRQPRFKSNAA